MAAGPASADSPPSSLFLTPANDSVASSSPTAYDSSPTPPGHTPRTKPEPTGRDVILRLFLALAVATAVSLLWFAAIVPDGANKTRIYVALAGNLALPVVAWFILKWIGRRKGH